MTDILCSYLMKILIVFLNFLAPIGLIVQRDVPYALGDSHCADIYKLPNSSGRPAIVYLYGGGWREGSKERAAFVAGTLARRGYVVVVPEYRHFPRVGLPEILTDHAGAISWTLAHATELGGDSHRVIIAGSSSGAWGAAMLVLDPRWLELYGFNPGDLAGMIGMAGPYMTSSLTDERDREVFRGTGRDMEPINHARAFHPPMLLLTGTADRDVLPISTSVLAQRLGGSIGAVVSRFYTELGHDEIIRSLIFPFSQYGSVAKDIESFIENLSKKQ